jgi:asparagine synthase (glutamine-hydrolysing)
MPDPAIRGIQAGSSLLSNLATDSQIIGKATKAMKIVGKNPIERYASLVTHSSDEELPQIWKGPKGNAFNYLQKAFDEADGPTDMDQILQVDLNTYLPNDLLVKVDRASMAHSLEVRSPFLDHKVVEQAARIPAKYKWRHGNKKWILKRAFEDMLPETVISRKKQGFGIPINEWFRGELEQLARESIEILGCREEFDQSGLRLILKNHVSGQGDNGYLLWDFVMLAHWYQRFIDD